MIKQYKQDFYKLDYSIIEPGKIFDRNQIKHFLKIVKKSLPSYSNSSSNFNKKSFNNVKVYGLPLKFRSSRGQKLRNKVYSNYYGKRAVLEIHQWKIENTKILIDIIANQNLLTLAKDILETDKISFHNGSISACYPGYPGVQSFHSDTGHFTISPEQAVLSRQEKQYQINFIIYLNDVDKTVSPLCLIPSTFKKINKINNQVSKFYGSKLDKDSLSQGNPVYPELLSDLPESSLKVTGSGGTVLCLNSGALHRETENLTSNRTRYAILLTYTKFHSPFVKMYSKNFNEVRAVRRFCNLFDDKQIILKSFVESGKYMPFFKKKIKTNINKYFFRPSVKYSPSIDKKTDIYRLTNNVSFELTYKYIGDYAYKPIIDNSKANKKLVLRRSDYLKINNFNSGSILIHNLFEYFSNFSSQRILNDVYNVMDINTKCYILIPNSIKNLEFYKMRNLKNLQWLQNSKVSNWDSLLRMIMRTICEPIIDNYNDIELLNMFSSMKNTDFMEYLRVETDKPKNNKYILNNLIINWWDNKKIITFMTNSGFKNIKVNFLDNYNTELNFTNKKKLFFNRKDLILAIGEKNDK
tara:strand:- start:424 stop:2166 length:1743 start_codon:yes stop_codon:yes gene_type:complete